MIRKIYFCTAELNKNDDEQREVNINGITDMEPFGYGNKGE
jgi:hypothetical protein